MKVKRGGLSQQELPQLVTKEKVTILVLGFGAEKNVFNGEVFESYNQYKERIAGHPVTILRNEKMNRTLLNLVGHVCGLPPSFQNVFVKAVFNEICNGLVKGKDVLACGHSFGGAVVIRAVQKVIEYNKTLSPEKKLPLKNLHIVTFGSIYIPDTPIKGVDIEHYMFKNDVALKCNGLSPEKEGWLGKLKQRHKLVNWLISEKNTYTKNGKKPPLNILGTNIQWSIHNDYEDYENRIIITRNIKLFKNVENTKHSKTKQLSNLPISSKTIPRKSNSNTKGSLKLENNSQYNSQMSNTKINKPKNKSSADT